MQRCTACFGNAGSGLHIVHRQGVDREHITVRLVTLGWARAAVVAVHASGTGVLEVGAAAKGRCGQTLRCIACALGQTSGGGGHVVNRPMPKACACGCIGVVHLQADGLGACRQVFPFQRGRHIAAFATKAIQDELVVEFLALQIGAGQGELATLGVGHGHASGQQQSADPLNLLF